MDTPDSPRTSGSSPGTADTPGPGPPAPLLVPVRLRRRHDGWTPERQHDFIAALAQSGCVTEAAAAVGMTARSAYRLRVRPDASAFRQSWDIALDYAIRNLSDAAFSRALHGVATPVFYRGEQVGERRRFDERLTMFLLRYRDPVRYGAWLDSMEARRHPDGAAIVLANALNVLFDRAHGVPPEANPFDEDAPEPPLAEGPVPSAAAGAPDPDDPCPDLTRAVREYAAEIRARELQDDHSHEWRDPLVTRSPRVRRR